MQFSGTCASTATTKTAIIATTAINAIESSYCWQSATTLYFILVWALGACRVVHMFIPICTCMMDMSVCLCVYEHVCVYAWEIVSLTRTCSAVLRRFSISKLLVREVGLVAAATICAGVGSTDDGAGELSASGEYKSLPVPSVKEKCTQINEHNEEIYLDEYIYIYIYRTRIYVYTCVSTLRVAAYGLWCWKQVVAQSADLQMFVCMRVYMCVFVSHLNLHFYRYIWV